MAGRSKDFFEQLREKLVDNPTKEQERDFWSRFDREFGPRPMIALRPVLKRWRAPHWQWLVPIGVAFLLAIVLMPGLHPGRRSMTHVTLVQDLDLFLTADEEWKRLLSGGEIPRQERAGTTESPDLRENVARLAKLRPEERARVEERHRRFLRLSTEDQKKVRERFRRRRR